MNWFQILSTDKFTFLTIWYIQKKNNYNDEIVEAAIWLKQDPEIGSLLAIYSYLFSNKEQGIRSRLPILKFQLTYVPSMDMN